MQRILFPAFYLRIGIPVWYPYFSPFEQPWRDTVLAEAAAGWSVVRRSVREGPLARSLPALASSSLPTTSAMASSAAATARKSKSEKEREKGVQDRLQLLLTAMLKDEDNKYCVDCDSKGPRWASWNLGLFVCIR